MEVRPVEALSSLRFVKSISVPVRSAPLRSAPLRFAKLRSAPLR